MRTRRSLTPEASLTPRLLGREAAQLAVLAALSIAALAFAPDWLRLVTAVVDALVVVVSAVALVIAWRVSGVTRATAVYSGGVVVFALLAVANVLAA